MKQKISSPSEICREFKETAAANTSVQNIISKNIKFLVYVFKPMRTFIVKNIWTLSDFKISYFFDSHFCFAV
jgi:hypothetical protein